MWNDPWWMSLLHLLFCCDNLRKSKFMALEKPGKLGEFFLLLCGHPAFMSPNQQRRSPEGLSWNQPRAHSCRILSRPSNLFNGHFPRKPTRLILLRQLILTWASSRRWQKFFMSLPGLSIFVYRSNCCWRWDIFFYGCLSVCGVCDNSKLMQTRSVGKCR